MIDINDPNFFMTNSTQKPEMPFKATISPQELETKNAITSISLYQLTWRDGVVYVSGRDGVELGRLTDETEAVYGDGIKYLEDQGKHVFVMGQMEVVGDSVFGNVGLREDVKQFFKGAVPDSVLRARAAASAAKMMEEAQHRAEASTAVPEEPVDPDPQAEPKRRGILGKLFKR